MSRDAAILLSIQAAGQNLPELLTILSAPPDLYAPRGFSCNVLTQPETVIYWPELSGLFQQALFASSNWEDPGLRWVFKHLLDIESSSTRTAYPEPLTTLFVNLALSEPSSFPKSTPTMDEAEWNRMFTSFWTLGVTYSCISERTFSDWPVGFGARHKSPRTGACAIAWRLVSELDRLPAYKLSSVCEIYKDVLQDKKHEGTLHLLKQVTDYLRSGGYARRGGQGRHFVKDLWCIAVDAWKVWKKRWTGTYIGRMLAVPILQDWVRSEDHEVRWKMQILGKLLQGPKTYAGDPTKVFDVVLETLNSERHSTKPTPMFIHVVYRILEAYNLERDRSEPFILDPKLSKFLNRCMIYAYTQRPPPLDIYNVFQIIGEKIWGADSDSSYAMYSRRGNSSIVDGGVRQALHTVEIIKAVLDGFCEFAVDSDNILSAVDRRHGPDWFFELVLVNLKSVQFTHENLETLAPFLSAPFLRSTGPGRAASFFGQFWFATFAKEPETEYKVDALKPALQYFMPKYVDAFDLERDTVTGIMEDWLEDELEREAGVEVDEHAEFIREAERRRGRE